MAKCLYCGADTILHINGIPVCVECDEKRNNSPKPLLTAMDREVKSKAKTTAA